MREGYRERGCFRYVNRWAGRGVGQRRFTRDHQWRGRFKDGPIKGGETYEDKMQDDQNGWQQVQHRRSRKNGSWGGRKVDFAPRSNKMQGDEKNVVSFFFTNFPISYMARDMYHVFSKHGRIVEVLIPARTDYRRKRFGFVRFEDVVEQERLAVRLDNIFVEGEKLHVNLPRHSREVSEVVNKRKTLHSHHGNLLNKLLMCLFNKFGSRRNLVMQNTT